MPAQRQLFAPPAAIPWSALPMSVKAERARSGAGSGEGLEFKAAPAGTPAPAVLPEKREVTLYGAMINGIDESGDLFAPTAFDEDLARDLPKGDLKLFLQHTLPLGVIREALVDDVGLKGVGTVAAVSELDRPLAQIADGTYGRASVGYEVRDVASTKELKALQDNDHGPDLKRYIKVARAREESAVLWGMHQDAHVVGVKSAGDAIAWGEIKSALDQITTAALADTEISELRMILDLLPNAEKALRAELIARETKALDEEQTAIFAALRRRTASFRATPGR